MEHKEVYLAIMKSVSLRRYVYLIDFKNDIINLNYNFIP